MKTTKAQIIKETQRGDGIHTTQTRFTPHFDNYTAHRRILRDGNPTSKWVKIPGEFSLTEVDKIMREGSN